MATLRQRRTRRVDSAKKPFRRRVRRGILGFGAETHVTSHRYPFSGRADRKYGSFEGRTLRQLGWCSTPATGTPCSTSRRSSRSARRRPARMMTGEKVSPRNRRKNEISCQWGCRVSTNLVIVVQVADFARRHGTEYRECQGSAQIHGRRPKSDALPLRTMRQHGQFRKNCALR